MKQLALALVMTAQAALAEGAFPLTWPAKERAALEHQIAADRARSAEPFRQVAALRASLARLDHDRRGRYAPVTSWLNAVPQATWALADAIVFSGAVDANLPASARVAWQAGLLESLGARREPKTERLLVAVLVSPGLEPAVRRSAADALGRLGTDGAAQALVEAATATAGVDREAVLAGMGTCRRLAVTTFLAQALARATAETEQLALIKALSVNGNAWALETPAGAPAPAETRRIQTVAAGALVKRFVASSSRVKTEAHDALRIVNAPDTPLLLAQVRAADPTGVDALLQDLRR
ncbi:MAG: HEAT repeat domain-containing protein [Myxococcaceae bacterium]|nr:HEAT repeat domain-containing protein [Myxococcaceae bacterium]